MLSFFQSSRSRAEPIFLYEIVHGSGIDERLLLTDAEVPITLQSGVYRVTAIDHAEVKASGTLDNTKLEVRCPFDSPLTRIFLSYPPDRTTTLTIRQGDMNDLEGEFPVIWSGRILAFSVDNIEARFDCEPIGTAVRRPGLRRNFQYGCPHVLYGPQCKANRAARTVTSRAFSITGSAIELPGGWHGPFDTVKFNGGLAEWQVPAGSLITRTILQVNGNTLILGGLPTGLTTSLDIRLSVGCNHQLSDCRNLHHNTPNYGGQPWIPLKNPVGNYNSFY